MIRLHVARNQKAGEDERNQKIIQKSNMALEKLRQKKLGMANQLDARFVSESKRPTLRLTEVRANIEVAKDRLKQRNLEFIDQSDHGIDYSCGLKPDETEREFRIRTGLITPFFKMGVRRQKP